MKFRTIIIILIFTAAITVSYLYSAKVYRFYVQSYYTILKNENEASMLKKAYDIEKIKDYEYLLDYSDKILIIYPENKEARMLRGLSLLRIGNKREGAVIIISSITKNNISSNVVEESIEYLFNDGYYGDIISALDGVNIKNPMILYYYGISFFKRGEFKRSFKLLEESNLRGKKDYKIYYYLGIISGKLNKNKDSIKYLNRARSLNYRDRDINQALVDIYRKSGMLKQAEKIIRSQRK